MVAYAFYENDTRIMRYAEALTERGDQVEVISLRRDGQSSADVLGGVSVFRVQRRPSNANSKFSYLMDVLLFLVRAGWLLSRRQLRYGYQLIHVHSVPDFLVFTAILPRYFGAKIILDVHDLLPEFYASKFQTKQDSLLFRVLVFVEHMSCAFADHVIAANDLWQERLSSRSVKKEHCSSMVNVPDPAIFSPQGRTRDDSKFIILYPGTLNWHQGVDIAVRAFALIKDKVPNAEFHIYGEGPCQATLKELVAELGIQDRVFLNGFLPTRAVAKLIANADLGVVPKRAEGFGNEAFSTKIMEFMAMGVPVVVSETRIDRYYFNDSVVTFFRGGDEQDLARSILHLVNHPQFRQEQVRNALRFVEHNNWSIMKTGYLALVDGLAGTSKPTTGSADGSREPRAMAQKG